LPADHRAGERRVVPSPFRFRSAGLFGRF